MDYQKAAKDILAAIGGKENVVSAAHCATRLRLVIADNKKVNKQASLRHRVSYRSSSAQVL